MRTGSCARSGATSSIWVCCQTGRAASRSAAWVAPAELVTVAPSPHPMHALTTVELRGYGRELERAIAFFDRHAPVPPARDRLQATLEDVLAEQEDRARLTANA